MNKKPVSLALSLLQATSNLMPWRNLRHLATSKCLSSAAWLSFLLVLSPDPLLGQTHEDLFNPGVLHEIDPVIDPANWATLKAQYMENTRYRCQLRWRYQGRDVVVEK